MRASRKFVSTLFLVMVAVVCFARPAAAAVFTDPLSSGLDSNYWVAESNQPLYTIGTGDAAVRLSKPQGGNYGFQYLMIDFTQELHGNFDVSIQFKNALIDRVDGRPGNQVQLGAWFGGSYMYVVRSDEWLWSGANIGDNYHAYEGQTEHAGTLRGITSTTDNFGTMRITRVGSVVTGYYDGIQLYSASYNAESATVAFMLQNNGTTDATSVDFYNFSVTADQIVPEPATLSLLLLGGLTMLRRRRDRRR
jgi:hypothetical protein